MPPRSDQTRTLLTEREAAAAGKDRQLAELQRQVAELGAKAGAGAGANTGTPPVLQDARSGDHL